MTFLQGGNQHDKWLRFCDMHRQILAGTGLPEAIIQGEGRFRDLLRDGAAAGRGVEVSLTDLSPEQWVALEQFAAVFSTSGSRTPRWSCFRHSGGKPNAVIRGSAPSNLLHRPRPSKPRTSSRVSA
jgi:hypothetical protein